MLISELKQSKRIWLYGLGSFGKRVCLLFEYFGIEIYGILVSNANKNIDSYKGIKVKEFNVSEFDKNDLIIVTAIGQAKEEIISNLVREQINFLIWNSNLLRKLWKNCKYTFEERMSGNNKVCIVLSGYKDYLWQSVFKRLENNLPNDVDVCVCSAGKYVNELSRIAEENSWSYLSTEVNSVSLVQNICISLFSDAEWIYKMDEDMFVTHNMFSNMLRAAEEIIDSGTYEFGLCSPLIPVNANGYRYILERYKKLDDYVDKYGHATVGGCSQREIERNPDTAKYMWGKGGLPHIDVMAEDVSGDCRYEICSTRLSIGLILFQRELWESMQGFTVYGNMDLGIDEEDINAYCINNSKVMAIAMNSIAGHFGFGKQTDEMKKYYSDNRTLFDILS